jgi:hypothetical protein
LRGDVTQFVDLSLGSPVCTKLWRRKRHDRRMREWQREEKKTSKERR